MNWSERTVDNELRVDRYTVNDIIINYITDKYYVNRRYQRKLVWGIDEKRLLIDSMLKGIPLPAVLIAQYKLKENDNTILEIVDGMQRLNAIISFVIGEFPIKYHDDYKYFDPNANNEIYQLMMDDKIEKHSSLLPKSICQEFCRYQLPAIITGQDDKIIELIFSRINSTGKKISSQDLRQSMATGEFPDLVRRIASRVRKDYTYDDRINLCDMPKISVGYESSGYGVDLNTVFWRKHDLINSFNLKESKDEEIIETLIATVLLPNIFIKNTNNLNKLYEKGSSLNTQIEQKVLECGKDFLENKFSRVFDIIDMIFDSVNSNFSSYIFTQKNVRNKDECFKILFLALYRLLDSDEYVLLDYALVAEKIKKAKDLFIHFTQTEKTDHNDAANATDNLCDILRPYFSRRKIIVNNELIEDLNKRLSYSTLEQQMTEFKIGVSNFNSNTINNDCIHKIAKTLVAMSNTNNSNELGLVIVGIADSKKSYDEWHKVFKNSALIINQHYIPGVTLEAKKLCKNTDNLLRKLRIAISNEPISPTLKNYVLANFNTVNYYDTELIIFRSKNVGEVSLYDNIKYVRQGNETIEC